MGAWAARWVLEGRLEERERRREPGSCKGGLRDRVWGMVGGSAAVTAVGMTWPLGRMGAVCVGKVKPWGSATADFVTHGVVNRSGLLLL